MQKPDFIKFLTMATPQEINKVIEEKGKKPPKLKLGMVRVKK